MTFKISRRSALIGAGSFSALNLIGQNAFAKSSSVNEIADKIANDILRDSPESCTTYTIAPSLVGGPYVGKVSDRSLAAENVRNKLVGDWIAKLSKIPSEGLSKTDYLTQKIVLSSAKYSHAAAKFGFGDAGYGSPNPYICLLYTSRCV